MRRIIFMAVSAALVAATMALGSGGAVAGKLTCELDSDGFVMADPETGELLCSGGPANPDGPGDVGQGQGTSKEEDGIVTKTGGGGSGGIVDRGATCELDPDTGETSCRPFMGGGGGGGGGHTSEIVEDFKSKDDPGIVSSSGGSGSGGKGTGGGGGGGRCTVEKGCVGGGSPSE